MKVLLLLSLLTAPVVARGQGRLGPPSGSADKSANRTYYEFQVDRPVMPLGVPKPPRYPDELRGVGLEGEVKAQFVVDTLGKADLSTFRVISSPHELFSKAVKAALPNMQYSPARLGGRKVRQVVVQPFLLTPGR